MKNDVLCVLPTSYGESSKNAYYSHFLSIFSFLQIKKVYSEFSARSKKSLHNLIVICTYGWLNCPLDITWKDVVLVGIFILNDNILF